MLSIAGRPRAAEWFGNTFQMVAALRGVGWLAFGRRGREIVTADAGRVVDTSCLGRETRRVAERTGTCCEGEVKMTMPTNHEKGCKAGACLFMICFI